MRGARGVSRASEVGCRWVGHDEAGWVELGVAGGTGWMGAGCVWNRK